MASFRRKYMEASIWRYAVLEEVRNRILAEMLQRIYSVVRKMGLRNPRTTEHKGMKPHYKVVNTEGGQRRPNTRIIYASRGEFKTNRITPALLQQQQRSHRTWGHMIIILKFIRRPLLEEPVRSLKHQKRNDEWVLPLPYIRIHFIILYYFLFILKSILFNKPLCRWLTFNTIHFKITLMKSGGLCWDEHWV